jgi:hypothetical protein
VTFVNISLLAGTALVALPIVLHLIMRQRPKRFEFPALRFIQRRHDANRRRLRLRHLLLLLLRAAAIALLAFALARPSMRLTAALSTQEAPVAAALVFDTAPRMEYRQDNQTRLEAARQLGLWLLAQLPRESQIAVLDTRWGPAAFQVDRGAAKQRIRRLETLSNSQPLCAAVEEALRLISQSELARKEIYIFTDLSRGAWPSDAAARLQKRLADVPGVGIYLLDVGVENPANFALGEVRLSGQVLSSRSPLGVETELTRTGAASQGAAEDRVVELYLLDAKGQPQKRSEESYTLKPGASRRVEFRVDVPELGTHQGFLRIVGQDALACDDTRYFTVEVKPPWRILVAAPRPAQGYAVFLTQALASTEARQSGQASFDCEVVDLGGLPQRTLSDYAAVCLVDPTPLEPATWQKLGDFASGGGGVAIFLGRHAQPIDSFNIPAAQELLPGNLLRQARRPDGDCFLAPRDYQHPILAALGRYASEIPWAQYPVFRYWELDKPPAGVGVVLPLSDGRPALLERPLGNGRALTMTTPVSDRLDAKAWNLLPAGAWPFVPLVNQIAAYLVGSSNQQLNYFAGQTAVLPLDAQSQRRTYLLSPPGELPFPLSADPKERLLAITATDQAGNYRVQAGGSASGVDLGFSVNLAAEQTELDRITPAELTEVFGPFRYRLARTREQIDRDISMGRVGRELFSALILMVAVVLLTEHVVANRFYKE